MPRTVVTDIDGWLPSEKRQLANDLTWEERVEAGANVRRPRLFFEEDEENHDSFALPGGAETSAKPPKKRKTGEGLVPRLSVLWKTRREADTRRMFQVENGGQLQRLGGSMGFLRMKMRLHKTEWGISTSGCSVAARISAPNAQSVARYRQPEEPAVVEETFERPPRKKIGTVLDLVSSDEEDDVEPRIGGLAGVAPAEPVLGPTEPAGSSRPLKVKQAPFEDSNVALSTMARMLTGLPAKAPIPPATKTKSVGGRGKPIPKPTRTKPSRGSFYGAVQNVVKSPKLSDSPPRPPKKRLVPRAPRSGEKT